MLNVCNYFVWRPAEYSTFTRNCLFANQIAGAKTIKPQKNDY